MLLPPLEGEALLNSAAKAKVQDDFSSIKIARPDHTVSGGKMGIRFRGYHS